MDCDNCEIAIAKKLNLIFQNVAIVKITKIIKLKNFFSKNWFIETGF